MPDTSTPVPTAIEVFGASYAHGAILGSAVFGIFWGTVNALLVKKIVPEDAGVVQAVLRKRKAGGAAVNVSEADAGGDDKKLRAEAQLIVTQLNYIGLKITEGADSFLKREYLYLGAFSAAFAVLIGATVDAQAMGQEKVATNFPYTAASYLIGSGTSILAGYIGMTIAVFSNTRTTYQCCTSTHLGFIAAFRGGQVLGFVLVGLALLVLHLIVLTFKATWYDAELAKIMDTGACKDLKSDHTNEECKMQVEELTRRLFELVAGYGLGGSSVALFGRVGGGIYTKAADVGADLVGKTLKNLKEDDVSNPGTIADNVGDNVGDIAGMGADLFGSLAESTCAALVVSATSYDLITRTDALYFPLLITASGICASFFSVLCVHVQTVTVGNVQTVLKMQLLISCLLMTGAVLPSIYVLPETFSFRKAGGGKLDVTRWQAFGCVCFGLWSGMIIGFTTEYFTSNTHAPTLVLVESCNHGPAPNIIQGLALGYNSCIIPILCITATIGYAFSSAGMYGIGLSALGMLGSLPVALAIDGYGPISDNAGGIAEMSGLPAEIRKITDALDAAGNTTAAVGKGFAIGSACLVGLALFGAFITRIQGESVDILQPVQFAGLLVGAMLPYAFSALTMKAVGDAALEMMNFIIDDFRKMEAVYAHNQKGQQNPSADYNESKAEAELPDIKGEKGIFEAEGEAEFRDAFYTPDFLALKGDAGMQTYRPDYDGCISISTEASLKMMVAPGILVIASPLVAGFLWGPDATAGLLAGAIVSGVQVAISASNTGGAWDNCKKEVEATRAAFEVCYEEHGVDIKAACAAAIPEGAPKYTEDKKNDLDKVWKNDYMVANYKADDEDTLYMWALKYQALKDKKNASVVGDTVGDPLKDTSGPAINILIKLSAITSLIFGNYIKDNYVFGNPANKVVKAPAASTS